MPSSPTSSSSSLRRARRSAARTPRTRSANSMFSRDGHVAEERVVLEHEADVALPRRDAGDVAAVQRDAPVVDLGEAGDGAQERALAAAAGPEQDEELALLDLERDVVDDRLRWYRLVTWSSAIDMLRPT